MGFTLGSWKEQAAERLSQTGQRLAGWATRDGPYLVYGGLCGLTLWPAIHAAQGGEFLPVMGALANVVGGIGGDLIAEQVGRWKDRTDRVEEAELAAWAAQQAAENPDLRQALDDLLERLEAIPQAQAGLGEDDRRWLAQTLQAELAGLGSLARFEAALSAPWTLVQSGGVLVKGGVTGDLVTGSKVTTFDQRRQTVGRQVNLVGDGAEPDEPA